MKKFSKMLALGLAAALTFGMTVSAAGSPTTGDNGGVGAIFANDAISAGGVKDAAGNVVDVEVKAGTVNEEHFNEAFGVDYEDAIKKVDANPEINAALDKVLEGLPVGSYDVNRAIINVEVDNVPAGGLYVSLWTVGTYENEKGYVIGHWNGREWEVLQTKVENGFVYAFFPEGFSPVYLSVLTVSEEEQPPTSPTPPTGGGSDNSDSGDSTPTSPKTGETLPVAGILAVICLAGVAVCAKKVGYNK